VAGEIALDDRQIFGEAIALAQVSRLRMALILGQLLLCEPDAPLDTEEVGCRAGWHEVRMQARLHDVLQSRSLPDELVAPSHLPAQGQRPLVRHPDLRQEARGVELCQHRGIDLVGLDLGMAISRTCLGLATMTRPTWATAVALPVASITTWASRVSAPANLAKRSRFNSIRPSRTTRPSSRADASAKTR
jgi:hypothetical protein